MLYDGINASLVPLDMMKRTHPDLEIMLTALVMQ